MEKFDFDTNALRAISGGILLFLALACITTKYESQSVSLIMVALASFLVGGAFIGKNKIDGNDEI